MSNDPKVYLSASEGKYRVIQGGVPISADKRTAAEALAVADHFRLKVSDKMWDGDAGRWRSLRGARDPRPLGKRRGRGSVTAGRSRQSLRRRDPASEYPAGITRADLERQTKPLLEEAFRADPYLTDEIVRRIFGHSTFTWSRVTVPQIRALRRAIYPLVLEARG